ATARPVGGGHLVAWQRSNRPTVVRDRLCVCLPWSEDPPPAGVTIVDIDPGGAFGAGSHPTTRLLLAELAHRLQGGDRVLDVGCGSGALAVAAARMGAAHAVGVDIEDLAL